MNEDGTSVQLRQVKLVVDNDSSNSNYHNQPGSTLTMVSEPDMKFGKDNPAFVPDTDAAEKRENVRFFSFGKIFNVTLKKTQYFKSLSLKKNTFHYNHFT